MLTEFVVDGKSITELLNSGLINIGRVKTKAKTAAIMGTMMSGLRHLYINKKRLVEVNSMCGRVCVNQ